MDKLNKKELVELATNCQSELTRYKARFKDLVAAHKALLKEKELLENSLKSITKGQPKVSEDEEEIARTSEEESPEHLKGQLAMLMNSLAKLSEEKSRMEAAFQADKKQLRSEKIQAENRIKELESRLEHETRAHLGEMENFKAKLILERHQREKEHNDHGVMIRELQKVVYDERAKNDKIEVNVETLNSKLVESQKALEESQREAEELKEQFETYKNKFKSDKISDGATAEKLQIQLEQLKRQHIQNSIIEQEKFKEAEEKSRRQNAVHEERVANLEARLAELSQTVGLYDRLRYNDQIAIDKLKERISQLEIERSEEKSDATNPEDIAESVRKLKKLLRDLSETSEKNFDYKSIIEELLDDNAFAEEFHKICKEDYEQLKNDFETYKKQFQFPQKPTSSFRVEVSNKEQELTSQITKLKERISSLHQQIDNNEKLNKAETDKLSLSLIQEKRKNHAKIQEIEAEWRSKVQSLETQLTKQRERALCLVNEKEQDISDLRESLSSLIPKRISTEKTSEGEGVVLHYTDELARRDVELSRLRKDKYGLESELRELRREMTQIASHEQHLSSLLHQQLQRFEQCQSREGANLEYLKNVVFNFLLSSDSNSKCHMLNAIAAVLKFTDAEKLKITQNSWWYKPKT